MRIITRPLRRKRAVARFLMKCLILLAFAGLPAWTQPSQQSVTMRNNRGEATVEFRQPLTGRQRAELVRAGVRFQRPLGGARYKVIVDRQGLTALQSHPLFVSITDVQRDRKISATIRAGRPARHALAPDGSIRVVVRFYGDVTFGAAVSTLSRAGLRPAAERSAFDFGNRLTASGTAAQIAALAASSQVEWIQEVPPPGQLDNETAAQLSNVHLVHAAPYNLTGNGVRVGIWDGGPVRTTHQDLTARVVQIESGSDSLRDRDHGTHVAGTIASSGANNSTARGMATAVQVRAWRFNDGDFLGEQLIGHDVNGIRAANHSWGPVIGWNFDNSTSMWTDTGNANLFGAYEGDAQATDELVRSRPTLTIISSAGNDRDDCPSTSQCDGFFSSGRQWDLIGTWKNAKNVIAVAAVEDNGTNGASFSNAGPSDDGRIKPDIAANGVSLTSTCDGSDSDYCVKSGTSMSAPVVTGAIALLFQRYQQVYGTVASPSADVMKALLANTATDIGTPGPDYEFGFGRLDALAAVRTIDAGPVRILTGAIETNVLKEYQLPVPSGTPAIRVTLSWLDPEGEASTDENDSDPDLINNLDLELVSPNNTIHYPFRGPGRGNVNSPATRTGPNPIDNVEQAVVENPQPGFWKIRVRGTAVPDGPQNYALVSNLSLNLPNQPEIEVNAPLAFDRLCTNGRQVRTVSIFNLGGAPLQVASVTLAGSPVFSIVSGPQAPFVIQPGAHVDYSVQFQPLTSSMSFGGTFNIMSNDADEPTVTLDMSGSSGAPAIDAIIAANGQFGNVCRESSKDLVLTIANSGSCVLDVASIASSSADFTVATVQGYPLSIGPGDSLSIPIRYKSANLGPDTGTLTVASNDPLRSTVQVSVSGNAPPGDLIVSGSLEFGNVCAGVQSEKSVSLCNLGLCNINVASVSLIGPNGGACADFTIENNPFAGPAPISKDFCAPLTIRFTPTSVGSKSCTLKILSDDPDTPEIVRTLTATTPAPQLSVPPSLTFAPEVIQSIGQCTNNRPVTISNTGSCPVTVNDAVVSAGAADYSLSGRPATPIAVQSGQLFGDGNFRAVFGPAAINRNVPGQLRVTWVTDPFLNQTMVSNVNFCGEGTRTGARVLVRHRGVPIPLVERLQLQRINANRNKQDLDSLENARDLSLQSVVPAAPCQPFQFHREYGTESNPVQLLPGSYQVTVTAVIGGRRQTKTVGFDVTTCDFNPQVIVDF